MSTGVVALPDGRALTWEEYGDPAGRPLVHHHGGMSCALDAACLDAVCAARGVRLLAIDRPGIRGSSRHRGYGVRDLAVDVGDLADHLGLQRLAVSGWSAGGPHALACAAVLGERVTAVATVGAPAPSDSGHLGLAVDRFLYPVSRHAAPLAALAVRVTARAPARLKQSQTRRAVGCAADRRVLDGLPPGTLAAWLDGAQSQGPWGVLDDYAATGADWGPMLAAVSVPVHVVHGTDDRLVPVDHARRLATGIDGARLRLLDGQGHFLLHTHGAEVLAAMGL